MLPGIVVFMVQLLSHAWLCDPKDCSILGFSAIRDIYIHIYIYIFFFSFPSFYYSQSQSWPTRELNFWTLLPGSVIWRFTFYQVLPLKTEVYTKVAFLLLLLRLSFPGVSPVLTWQTWYETRMTHFVKLSWWCDHSPRAKYPGMWS